jgi:hypothetical protein
MTPSLQCQNTKADLTGMKGMKGMGTNYKKPIPKVLIYPDYLFYPCLSGFYPLYPLYPC